MVTALDGTGLAQKPILSVGLGLLSNSALNEQNAGNKNKAVFEH